MSTVNIFYYVLTPIMYSFPYPLVEFVIVILLVVCGSYILFLAYKSKFDNEYINKSFSNDLYSAFIDAENKSDTSILFVTDKFWNREYKLNALLTKYIVDINDEDNTFINLINSFTKNLSLIIDTNGGNIDVNDKMVKSILKYSSHNDVNTYVPCQAYSAGSVLALVGKKIFIGKCAILSPIDPQIGVEVPNVDISSYSSDVIKKSHLMTTDPTFIDNIIYQEATKYHNENILNTKMILKHNKYGYHTIKKVISEMCSGKYTHSKPFDFNNLKSMGLRVTNAIPEHIKELTDKLYKYRLSFD